MKLNEFMWHLFIPQKTRQQQQQLQQRHLVSGADTGGVDRVDIHPPFLSKKKFEMSLYLK